MKCSNSVDTIRAGVPTYFSGLQSHIFLLQVTAMQLRFSSNKAEKGRIKYFGIILARKLLLKLAK